MEDPYAQLPTLGRLEGLPESLIERQVELEHEMRGLAIKRDQDQIIDARQQGEESTTRYGVRMVKLAMADLADAIRAFVAEACAGKRGRRHSAAVYLRDIDPEVAAMITAKAVLDRIGNEALLARPRRSRPCSRPGRTR